MWLLFGASEAGGASKLCDGLESLLKLGVTLGLGSDAAQCSWDAVKKDTGSTRAFLC